MEFVEIDRPSARSPDHDSGASDCPLEGANGNVGPQIDPLLSALTAGERSRSHNVGAPGRRQVSNTHVNRARWSPCAILQSDALHLYLQHQT